MKASLSRTFTLPTGARRSSRDATEQRILSATHDLLQGGASLAGLSIARIVKQAGVSRATFYLHFPDKRALVARLAGQRLSEFGAITDPFLENPQAGRDELAEVVIRLVQNWRAQAGVLAGLIELSEYDQAARDAWHGVVRGIAATIATALRRFRPDLDSDQCEVLAEVIAWMGERACHQMAGTGTDMDQVDRTAEALTEAVWRIIAP